MKLGSNWYNNIGTPAENSPHREAPNRHEKGNRKYQEKISRDMKSSNDLPFTFSKPNKSTPKGKEDIIHICDNCHFISLVSKIRVGQSCKSCRTYTSVNSENTFETEEQLESYLLSKENV
jgi:hypothetical protein